MRSTTSSSNIFRRKLCPGSHNAEEGILDAGGDAADEGTLLHPFAINPDLARDHLTEAQRALLRTADAGTKQFLGEVERAFTTGPIEYEKLAKWSEERLDVRGPDGELLFRGQCDVAYDIPMNSGAVAVQDFKMGFLEVTHAAENYQLASYAVAWSDYLERPRALVAINQPRGVQKLTLSLYGKPALEGARRELAAIVHAAEDPNAPRIAGEAQCQWCRAKLWCDEYKRRFSALAAGPETRSIATLDNDELGYFALAVKAAKRIEKAVIDELRRRIENDEMPGWHLEENGEMREVVDIVGAYQAFAAFFEPLGGIKAARFTACTKLSLTDLADYTRELTGFSLTRSKALVSEMLNPFIARRQKRPTPTPDDKA